MIFLNKGLETAGCPCKSEAEKNKNKESVCPGKLTKVQLPERRQEGHCY